MRGALFALLAVSGCQCFVPVEEGDAGARDAGGADASTVECASAADCVARVPDGGLPWCSGAISASCLSGRCITECAAARTCAVTSARCLTCRPPAASKCGESSCAGQRTCELSVEWSTCASGPVAGSRFVATLNATCEYEVRMPDGGARAGEWFDLDVGEAIGHFAGVDGACVGRDLFTGVPRMEWSCPGGCNFLAVGCD